MTISLGSNVGALRTQRYINQTSDRISQIFERLSSGKRINRASDDPAGLAIAMSLQAQQRIAGVAIRNAQDGVSSIQIADGALGEITNILSRMAELAQQSANGVYSNAQRSALQLEFSALASEIDRITRTTEFNGIFLIGGPGAAALQIGLDGGVNSKIAIPAVDASLSALGLAFNGSTLIFSISASSTPSSQSASWQALDAVTSAIDRVSNARGMLGATESRLDVAIHALSVQKENLAAAESRIMDVDVAAEMAELTRLLILQQAQMAVLAQVNQQPALALTLLR